jgi:dihydrofolate reductase
MKTSIIVAAASNNAIGKDNDLLWHLPADMKHFKQLTSGHCILTGRKNFESIPEKFRPLPNRTNIIITRNKDLKVDTCHVFTSIQEGIDFAKSTGEQELFIIGGGEIYRESIEQNLIRKIYLTRVHQTFAADTFFPELEEKDWEVVSELFMAKDEKNPFDCTFYELEKR